MRIKEMNKWPNKTTRPYVGLEVLEKNRATPSTEGGGFGKRPRKEGGGYGKRPRTEGPGHGKK